MRLNERINKIKLNKALYNRHNSEEMLNYIKNINELLKEPRNSIDARDIKKILDSINGIKLDPTINIDNRELNKITRILSEFNKNIEVKFPSKPKEAIPVVLTDKNKEEFYDALSKLSGFVSGIDTSKLSKEATLQELLQSQNETPPTDDSKNNPSKIFEYTDGNLTKIVMTIGTKSYEKTFNYVDGNLSSSSSWAEI